MESKLIKSKITHNKLFSGANNYYIHNIKALKEN